jgi:hypothetical protein
MNVFRCITAFSILTLISLFLFFNLKSLEGGTGNIFIAIAAVFVIVLMLLDRSYTIICKIKPSLAISAIFVIYFMYNYLMDSMSLEALKEVTVGTTGGIVFGLGLGLICSYCMAIIYDLRYVGLGVYRLTYCLVIVYTLLLLVFAINVFSHHFSNVRSDLFLIVDQNGFYQRIGTFLFIQFMLLLSLLAVLFVTSRTKTLVQYLAMITVPLMVAVIYGATSQLVGSNSGLVSIIGFLAVFYVFLFVVSHKKAYSAYFNIKIKNILLGWIGLRVFKAVAVTLIGFVIFVIMLIELSGIDPKIFRVMGFGKNSDNSSMGSRIEILRNNFIEQLSYNPIFGNTQVDDLTTGVGTYAHSLISLLTHLGVVGLSIFIVLIFQMYYEITKKRKDSRLSIYNDNRYGTFRLFSLTTVLFFATLTAFYTWLPLWFAIGLFGIGLVYESKRNIKIGISK